MLRQKKDDRTLAENLMLASSTAFVAGVINVAGFACLFNIHIKYNRPRC